MGGRRAARVPDADSTLTVKYPTTADGVPDGGDDAGGRHVTHVETTKTRGRSGQRRHGAGPFTFGLRYRYRSPFPVPKRRRRAIAWKLLRALHARAASPPRPPLEIIDGRAGSGWRVRTAGGATDDRYSRYGDSATSARAKCGICALPALREVLSCSGQRAEGGKAGGER